MHAIISTCARKIPYFFIQSYKPFCILRFSCRKISRLYCFSHRQMCIDDPYSLRSILLFILWPAIRFVMHKILICVPSLYTQSKTVLRLAGSDFTPIVCFSFLYFYIRRLLTVKYKLYIWFLIIPINITLSSFSKYRKTLILPRIYHD